MEDAGSGVYFTLPIRLHLPTLSLSLSLSLSRDANEDPAVVFPRAEHFMEQRASQRCIKCNKSGCKLGSSFCLSSAERLRHGARRELPHFPLVAHRLWDSPSRSPRWIPCVRRARVATPGRQVAPGRSPDTRQTRSLSLISSREFQRLGSTVSFTVGRKLGQILEIAIMGSEIEKPARARTRSTRSFHFFGRTCPASRTFNA